MAPRTSIVVPNVAGWLRGWQAVQVAAADAGPPRSGDQASEELLEEEVLEALEEARSGRAPDERGRPPGQLLELRAEAAQVDAERVSPLESLVHSSGRIATHASST
jgi:hypothetical protein